MQILLLTLRSSTARNSPTYSVSKHSWVTLTSMWLNIKLPPAGSCPSLEDAFIKLSATNTPSECSSPRKRLCYRGIIRIVIISIQQQIKITRLLTDTLRSLSTQQWATLAEAAGVFSFTLQLAYTRNHNKFWSHNGLENSGWRNDVKTSFFTSRKIKRAPAFRWEGLFQLRIVVNEARSEYLLT